MWMLWPLSRSVDPICRPGSNISRAADRFTFHWSQWSAGVCMFSWVMTNRCVLTDERRQMYLFMLIFLFQLKLNTSWYRLEVNEGQQRIMWVTHELSMIATANQRICWYWFLKAISDGYMKLFQKGFDNLRVRVGAGICQRDHIFASAHPPRQGERHPHMIKP